MAGRKTEDRREKTEVGRQKSEVGGQKTEVGRQSEENSEVGMKRNRKGEALMKESEARSSVSPSSAPALSGVEGFRDPRSDLGGKLAGLTKGGVPPFANPCGSQPIRDTDAGIVRGKVAGVASDQDVDINRGRT